LPEKYQATPDAISVPLAKPNRYNSSMRRKSAIDRDKQASRVERARRMTPESRLLACINISQTTEELQRNGKQYRERQQISRS